MYPLGFEPRLDGVGGRNVIQLHYEYVYSIFEPQGFVYAKESEHLIEQIRVIAREALYYCLDKGITDWAQMKYKMKEDLSKFIYSQTKRKPMILPIIMDM